MIRFKGKFLIEHVLDAALNSELGSVVLVLGYRYKTVLDAMAEKIRHPRLLVAINGRYRSGLSSSIKAGLRKVQKKFPSAMFLLGDQPMVNNEYINLLLNCFWASEKSICAPVFQGMRGNPVILTSRWYDRLTTLSGDVGARDIIASNHQELLEVCVYNQLLFIDIDTISDLSAIDEGQSGC
ncbi:MAG: hypothetical protein A2V65_04570 [Deltaproteobacteria bacterium RBG_13_49_15]|nr:MAG: hypothetical protein A2V65_04570 [Deltaproteobacteria bacterium RBG_13_49_15]